MQLARAGVGAVETDQPGHDSKGAGVSIRADEHGVGGAETVVDRLVEGVPPGRVEMINGLIRIEFEFHALLARRHFDLVFGRHPGLVVAHQAKVVVAVGVPIGHVVPEDRPLVGSCRNKGLLSGSSWLVICRSHMGLSRMKLSSTGALPGVTVLIVISNGSQGGIWIAV